MTIFDRRPDGHGLSSFLRGKSPAEVYGKMKILICEDNQLAIRTLTYVLEKEGFELDTANDGNKALSLMEKNDYDILLVDIHLPFLSGLELIKHLRAELKRETPVIVMSAFSDLQVQRQAGELGISGYIVKPFKLTDLIDKIRSILKM
jgi:two-component system, OmpR family, response regulator VicR